MDYNTFNNIVGGSNILSAVFGFISMGIGIFAIVQASRNEFFKLFKKLVEENSPNSIHKREMEKLNKENEHEVEMKKLENKKIQAEAQKIQAENTKAQITQITQI